MALTFADDWWATLLHRWGLKDSAARHAVRGAEVLGLVSRGQVTTRGRTYADIFALLGFDHERDRHLTRKRLVESEPRYAAILRSILLEHPVVDLIVQVLTTSQGRTMTIEELAARAYRIDEGMGRAAFGAPPLAGEPWQIRPWTRFNLKAAMYDVGLIDSPLAPGASAPQQPGGYDPRADPWQLGPTLVATIH